MRNLPASEELENESDVEQKLIYPLLTTDIPEGMGLPTAYIKTKRNIRRFNIGKGTEQKLYYPDYIIAIAGVPLVVIEAKGPGVDLTEAFREARLYAQELNAQYESGSNPVQTVIAANNLQLIIGSPDQATPKLIINIHELSSYSESLHDLSRLCSREFLEKQHERYINSLPKAQNFKPRRMLGGASVQNEEIQTNTFGATIAADFAHIFNPVTREDRQNVAKNGYIPSRRRERYVDPIDRVIRAATHSSEITATSIEDTSNPKEVISKFSQLKPLEHQVLLLVGSVGAGKSTFVDYLKEVALPRKIVDSTVWVRANMNVAPLSEHEIYDWLREQIVEGFKTEYTNIDFDNLDVLRNVYSVEINKFQKTIGQILDSNSQEYKVKFADLITSLQNNKHQTAIAFSRYCATERNKLPIIVLDNCDKRTRDQQLLMFQAAEWVQKEFRCLVILPLREETYDMHRNKPPLDTALKDLVFRIEAPLFQNLLLKRVQLALFEIKKKSTKKNLHYELTNGFRVEYPAEDSAFYLTSILKSIFEHDRYIRRIIVGLSARNMRRALELFLEFCTSGHIPEEEIFKIRQREGNYALPLRLVTRVLLRMNRRFYDNDQSYLKNIFAANWQDNNPTYFSRLIILRWLFKRISELGPSGEKGYFPIYQLKEAMVLYGFEISIINREIEALLKSQCIVSEDFRLEQLEDETLIKIAPAGVVHLDMLSNIDYLGALAEDTYFTNKEVATEIAERISSSETHYQRKTALQNS